MAVPPSTPADPRAIVAALESARVDYVVVGGWAAVTYGVDRATFDLDVVVAATDENAAALGEALDALAARRDLGAGITEAFELRDAGPLRAGPIRLATAAGPLAVLTRVAGASFDELRPDARRAAFGDGTSFVIVSKPALEGLKAAIADEADPSRGGRDRADLQALRDLEDPDLPPA
jgi:hypothetical protein